MPPPTPPRPRPRPQPEPSRTTSAKTPSGQQVAGAIAQGDQQFDRRWIVAFVICALVILLLLLVFVAAGIGLAVSSGMFSSGSESAQSANSAASEFDSASDGGAAENNSEDKSATASANDSSDESAIDSEAESGGPSAASPSGGSSVSDDDEFYTIPGGQFFGIEAVGQSFVYVIDVSGSMAGAPIQRAKQEIIRSISSLSYDQSFYVVFFADDEFPMHSPDIVRSLVDATPANVKETTQWIESFDEEGGTEPQAALSRALSLQPDAVYFLTDGEFDPNVVSFIKSSNRKGVKINTVSFVDRSGEALLKEIARTTGGTYLFVP